ncbi:uncharacterized protein LOC109718796 isoform X3 [Ananas comosus]|uniref:Uncharacterized protein LOC109718796 isoform X3 n=1 Tax=Ananas comosus TaxID=4615 RepID=A0A6P5FXQ6_ANACO|nr:uncharacterized protein LOC109718796 isoform X3 [Ananas comosus]
MHSPAFALPNFSSKMASSSSSSTSRWNPVIKPQPSDYQNLRKLAQKKWQRSRCFGGYWNESRSVQRRRKRGAFGEAPIVSATRVQCATSSSSMPTISNAEMPLADSLTAVKGSSAPLVQALKSAAQQAVSCFHFPGHNRGKAAPSSMSSLTGLGTFVHDLPELPELDDLFSPSGAILDAQRKASELFGSSRTWFLVNGTTCGIQASIMASCSPGKTLILPRNSHISAISGLVLSGAVPKYVMPEYNPEWDIPGAVTPLQVERAMKELERDGKTAAAVLLISPTYHGICSNVEEISKLCHSRGIPLIVDEAHGAHFGFHLGFPRTALEQGADLAVQSTHKVLSSLTQSSMLHSKGELVDADRVSRCLQMLQSSSPSYLLLASLDAARAQLSDNPEIFGRALDMSAEAKKHLSLIPGISVLGLSSFDSAFPAIDPLRITVGFSRLNISGYVADEIVSSEHHIVCELVGTRSQTFAVNLGTRKEDIQRLVLSMKHLSSDFYQANEGKTSLKSGVCAPLGTSSMQLTPRDAFFAKKRKVLIGESLGKICGELICPYPPGIPVLVPGEVITEDALSYLLDVRNMGAGISGAADDKLSSMLVCDF